MKLMRRRGGGEASLQILEDFFESFSFKSAQEKSFPFFPRYNEEKWRKSLACNVPVSFVTLIVP